MRLILLFLLLAFQISAQSPDLKAQVVKIPTGYSYRITNLEPVPVSVRLIGQLTNLEASKSLDQVFVVPAHTAAYEILQLHRIKNAKYGYRLRSIYLWGDQRHKTHDDYLYHLPYAKHKAYRVSQGNHGKITHNDTYAIDFTMPVGTAVHAARDGVVIQVKENESQGCTQAECEAKANFIRILHRDGTIAEYTHLKHLGAKVRKGQRILRDQLIGYSGNTGWTTGPHLHFTVYQPRFGKASRTIPVRFLLENNQITDDLLENEVYRKP